MQTAFLNAWNLIISGNAELTNILAVTARVCLNSSVIALMIGVPLGIWLGSGRFPGRELLIILNRTLTGMPPVVCGLIFYMLFSGVGPFGKYKMLFTVKLMILAQVVLITPIVVGNMETYVREISPKVLETAKGLRLSALRSFILLLNECLYPIFSAYLMAFARSIAEVGAVSMVGGAISWKTNVMTTAIMENTNKGSFTLGVALGIILMTISLIINVIISLLQRRFQ